MKESFYQDLVQKTLEKKAVFSEKPHVVAAKMLMGIQDQLIAMAANNLALIENDKLQDTIEAQAGKIRALQAFGEQKEAAFKAALQDKQNELDKAWNVLKLVAAENPSSIMVRIISGQSNPEKEVKALQDIVDKAKEVLPPCQEKSQEKKSKENIKLKQKHDHPATNGE